VTATHCLQRTFAYPGAGALLLLALSACDLLGPSSSDGPGFLDIELLSPQGPEGAALFELAGVEGLSGISSQGGWVFHHDQGERLRVVVILNDPGTIRFRVGTASVKKVPKVTILQVSGADDSLRASLSGHRVTVSAEREPGKGGQ
jgi:hypothetical protein